MGSGEGSKEEEEEAHPGEAIQRSPVDSPQSLGLLKPPTAQQKPGEVKKKPRKKRKPKDLTMRKIVIAWRRKKEGEGANEGGRKQKQRRNRMLGTQEE